jgi:hypothetical protein
MALGSAPDVRRASPEPATTATAPPPGLAGVWEATGRLAPMVLSNALVLFLLAAGRLSVLELLALVALETAGLQLVIGLGEIAYRRRRGARRRRERVFDLFGLAVRSALLVALVAALCGWQLLLLALFGVGLREMVVSGDRLVALPGSGILWPLAVTLVAAVREAARQRGRAPMASRQLGARLVTLLLGAIPLLVPFMAAVAFTGAAWRRQRRTRQRAETVGAPSKLVALLALDVALILAIFALFEPLRALGLLGWSLSFVTAKVVAELATAVRPGNRADESRGSRRHETTRPSS